MKGRADDPHMKLDTGRTGFGHEENPDDTLGGGFKYFLFSPLLGEMIQFD